MIASRFGCWLLAIVFGLPQTHDELLAMRFYPPALDGDNPAARYVTALRLDLAHAGRADFIAAAYSNGKAARLKVIRATGTPHVVAESPDVTMGGAGQPVLEAVDIDDDGIPEIAVHFRHETWLYKFKNDALVRFGPSIQGRVGFTTNLGDTNFADLDGDGILEILEDARGSSDSTYIVHKLDEHGVFQRTSEAVFFSQFERGDGSPEAAEQTFDAKPGNYVLRIVNGDQKAAHVVTSADIRLNGVVVAGSNDFRQGPRTLAIPVKLVASNTLHVTLRSEQGTLLTIAVTRSR
jgi:hypothetical protein